MIGRPNGAGAIGMAFRNGVVRNVRDLRESHLTDMSRTT